MSTLGWSVALAGCLGSAVWFAFLVHLARHRHLARFVADLPDSEPPGGWPGVALIFAARDEQGVVERAARSMLGLDYPDLEVIAVDDRSRDATGAILDAIAREPGGPGLRVVHVESLPPGWLGKTNALRRGADATAAPWLLFTDADAIYRPGALRRAIGFVLREQLDHLTVAFELPNDTIPERMFLALFGLLFGLACPLGRIGRRGSKAHMGVGAFNLVRAEAFRDVDGFRHIALSIDDDMMLAKVLKFAGHRGGALLGAGALAVRWQTGLWGMVRGLEKNFFAGLRFRLRYVLVAMAGFVVLGIAPFAGLAVGPWPTRAACLVGVATLVALLGATRSHSGIGGGYAFLIPIASVILMFTLFRSTWLTLRRGGVDWRGHLYPLDELRRHVDHRDAWLREVWASTR